MRDLVYPELSQESVVKPPADVVVTPQIVQECVLLRKCEHCSELVFKKPDVLRRDGVPCSCHRSDVVQDMTLRLLHCTEIRNHLRRLHHNLTQKKSSRTYNLTGHPHDPDQRVYLHEVAAGSSQLLPDIRNRVKPNDVHSLVAQVQHIVRHVVEYHRIPVVQIPLVRIEGRHDNLPGFLAPGEVPRSCRRKYLRNGLLELIRDRPVVEEEVTGLIFPVSAAGFPCPLVIFAGMVHHKVQAQAHPSAVACVGEVLKIVHGSQRGVHTPEVRYRVSAVAASLRTLQQRHQMQIIDSALMNIIKMLGHALQVLRKALCVHKHAGQAAVLIPLRQRFT